ncbi:hypothetical protein N7G274_009094 [Stereocaulon virgatum]|uniref:Arginyl-tRNA synthetase catalytic core domain-containing protein n=1 Tax=Stereocaulon virgatum TaxID=373712 RepID=A0ABR3ZZH0_9LECA
MVYVISFEQDNYMKRLFKVIEPMGYTDLATKLEHVNFGKVALLGDILNKCGDAMHDVMRNNDVKYQQVKDPQAHVGHTWRSRGHGQGYSGKRVHNYHFDIKRMTEPIGDTGPYLEFGYARLSSIVPKSGFNQEILRSKAGRLLLIKGAPRHRHSKANGAIPRRNPQRIQDPRINHHTNVPLQI